MKKIFTLLLLILCLFGITGCQNETRVDIERAVYGIDITFRLEDNGLSWQDKQYWDIKYYVDHEQFDLTTANSVELRTYIPTYDIHHNLNTYRKDFKGVIPDDVTPTKDNNYFLITLDASKFNPTRKYSYAVQEVPNYFEDDNGVKHYYPNEHLVMLSCNALVYEAPGTELGPNTLPSIFNTILYGIGMVIIGVILYWIAHIIIQNKYVLAGAFLVPVIVTIGSYIAWDVPRGIIMTVFFVIYYIVISIIAKRIDDYLDY